MVMNSPSGMFAQMSTIKLAIAGIQEWWCQRPPLLMLYVYID